MPKEKTGLDLDTMLHEAGAGDLAGEFDDLNLPEGSFGGEREASDEDEEHEDQDLGGEDQEDDKSDSEGDLLAHFGLADDEQDDDAGDDDAGDDDHGDDKSREALLVRDNDRLYRLVETLSAGHGNSTPAAEDTTPAKLPAFDLDLSSLKPPEGMEKEEWDESVQETAPILRLVLGQFNKQVVEPLQAKVQAMGGIVGDIHLRDKLPGWKDPKLAKIRNQIFSGLSPQMQAAMDTTEGAAILTLAAKAAVKAKTGKRKERDLGRRRGTTELGGGGGERKSPESNSRSKAIQKFTREASDEDFEKQLERITERSHR